MSIALDGFAIFTAIGNHAELFKPVRADVDKQARALFGKCLKGKSTTLEVLQTMYKALGTDSFELLIEGLKDAELKSALTKFDRHHPELKTATPAWRRQRLLALATGDAPAEPAKAAKKTTKKAPVEPQRLHSQVMDQYREGGPEPEKAAKKKKKKE